MSAFGSGASLVLRGCHCRLLHTHPLYLWGGEEGRGGEGVVEEREGSGGGNGGGRDGEGRGGEGRGGEKQQTIEVTTNSHLGLVTQVFSTLIAHSIKCE